MLFPTLDLKCNLEALNDIHSTLPFPQPTLLSILDLSFPSPHLTSCTYYRHSSPSFTLTLTPCSIPSQKQHTPTPSTMDFDDTMDIQRDEAPRLAFASMPAGPLPLANGPIPEAQLVKIARDVDVAIRQDGEERIVSWTGQYSEDQTLTSLLRSTCTVSLRMCRQWRINCEKRIRGKKLKGKPGLLSWYVKCIDKGSEWRHVLIYYRRNRSPS